MTPLSGAPRLFTPAGLVIMYVVLGVAVAAMVTRHDAGLWNRMPLIGGLEPGQHLSNFALSLMFIVAVGLFPILFGTYRTIGISMAAVVVINLVVELWVPILNTPDLADAWAGIAGVGVGGLALAIIQRFGTRPNPKFGPSPRPTVDRPGEMER
ncbi:hypothetical protein BH11MYX1_BH11MYX1_15460 [soil metagenome]